jgi:hypothetical protein
MYDKDLVLEIRTKKLGFELICLPLYYCIYLEMGVIRVDDSPVINQTISKQLIFIEMYECITNTEILYSKIIEVCGHKGYIDHLLADIKNIPEEENLNELDSQYELFPEDWGKQA